MFVYIIHYFSILFLAVHGYTVSRLYVQDTSDSNCNTNGETIRMWMNRTHMTTAPACFINQMRWVINALLLVTMQISTVSECFTKLLSA